MIFGLVIITSLGAATILDTFTDRFDCIREAAFIQTTTNNNTSVAQCWPGKNQEELEKRVHQINSAISSTIKR
jgi:hypothetical protein